MNPKKLGMIFLLMFIFSEVIAERTLTEKEVRKQFQERIGGILPSDKFREALKEEKSRHKQIEFFGKVVDQFGRPVLDANVTIGVTTMYVEGGVKTVKCLTDTNGIFILNDVGVDIDIWGIQKEGYEFILANNLIRYFNYDPSSGPCHILNFDKPVVFYMRKKGEIAFLIDQYYTLNANTEKSKYYQIKKYNLLGDQLNGWIDGNSIWHDFDQHYDIQVEVELFKDPNSYRITLNELDPNSGFVVSDKLLYEAPLEGYASEVVFEANIPKGAYEDIDKYIYIKARGGKFYSKTKAGISIQHTENPIRVYFVGTFMTNPDGTTTLEEDVLYNLKETERRMNIQKQTKEKERQKRLKKQREMEMLRYAPGFEEN
jgi:hypothetical protein